MEQTSSEQAAQPAIPPRPVLGRLLRRASLVVGTLGLLVYGAWWIECLRRFRFFGIRSWFIPWPYLGLDFSHSYLAVRKLWNGGNPYHETFGDYRGLHAYPPVSLALHLWTGFLPDMYAYAVHITIAVVALGFLVALLLRWRVRSDGTAPAGYEIWSFYPLILLAILLCAPVLFALERGSGDIWVLLALGAASAALRKKSLTRDVVAGVLLAIAICMKIYPFLLLPGLLALRRWRAAVVGAVATVLLFVIPWKATGWFLHNTVSAQHDRSADIVEGLRWLAHPTFGPLEQRRFATHWAHSLSTYWTPLLGQTFLGRVPGLLVVSLLFAGLGVWVGRKVYRSEQSSTVTLPFLLWITACGTFIMPFSFDYNLFFLPLAIVGLWRASDGWATHLLLGAYLLAWQPIALPISADLFMAAKVAGLAGSTLSLTRKLA
jgi:hypothetical protein